MDKTDWIAKGDSFKWMKWAKSAGRQVTVEDREEIERNMRFTYHLWGYNDHIKSDRAISSDAGNT